MAEEYTYRIEKEIEVMAYLQNLKYALDHGAKIAFQEKRKVDENRDERFTNTYTMGKLFPNENPVDALRRELKTLTVKEYLRTVKDTRFPHLDDMREFGKIYPENSEVYIKIRVNLLNTSGFIGHTTFVMSFHYAEKPFSEETFPYA